MFVRVGFQRSGFTGRDFGSSVPGSGFRVLLVFRVGESHRISQLQASGMTLHFSQSVRPEDE